MGSVTTEGRHVVSSSSSLSLSLSGFPVEITNSCGQTVLPVARQHAPNPKSHYIQGLVLDEHLNWVQLAATMYNCILYTQSNECANKPDWDKDETGNV